jgi:hypothetical protein
MIEGVNEAGRAAGMVLSPSGFTAGAGKDIWYLSRLAKRVRRAPDGLPVRPSRKLRVLVADAGSLRRSQVAAALKDPASSPSAIADLVPPESNVVVEILSRVAIASSICLFAYAAALLVVVPSASKVGTLYYGGQMMDGASFDAMQKVMQEPGIKVPKAESPESKKFYARVKEVKRELSN